MRRSSMRPPTVVAIWLALGACATPVDGGPDPLDGAITAVAAEVNLDAALMGAAGTVEEARAELARHLASMEETLETVRQRLADRCDARSRGMGTMAELVSQIEIRLAAYAAEIAAAGSMPAVADAARRYGDEMDALLERIMERWNGIDCR